MELQTSSGAMAVISAAVTPVVMISANALLIGAVTTRHQGMSDRLRHLTAEWRDPALTPERRDLIDRQILFFESRVDWLTRVHILLYLATVTGTSGSGEGAGHDPAGKPGCLRRRLCAAPQTKLIKHKQIRN